MRRIILVVLAGATLMAIIDLFPARSAQRVIILTTPASSASTGDILLVNGTDFILQTNAASFICRAGGC